VDCQEVHRKQHKKESKWRAAELKDEDHYDEKISKIKDAEQTHKQRHNKIAIDHTSSTAAKRTVSLQSTIISNHTHPRPQRGTIGTVCIRQKMPPVDLIIRISLVRGEPSSSSEDGTRFSTRMHGQGSDAFVQISGDDYNGESSGGALTELSPPVWRRFRVSSSVNLELLHDKVLCPVMGWTRNYHTFAFCGTGPVDERTYYVQECTDATDLMWQGRRTDGRPTLEAKDHTIGELLASVGDGCIYNYDLGDCFYHLLKLEEVVPELASTGKVEILDGEMRCPDEDGDGCAAYQEKVLDLYNRVKSDPTDAKSARKLGVACFERRGTLNVLGRFDPAEFDLDSRRAALADALNSRNSTYNSVKMFSSQPGFTMARLGQKGVTVKVYDPK